MSLGSTSGLKLFFLGDLVKKCIQIGASSVDNAKYWRYRQLMAWHFYPGSMQIHCLRVKEWREEDNFKSCNFIVCRQIENKTQHVHRHIHTGSTHWNDIHSSRASHTHQLGLDKHSGRLHSAVWELACWYKVFSCFQLSVSQVTSPLGVVMADLTITVMWFMLKAFTITSHVCLALSWHL